MIAAFDDDYDKTCLSLEMERKNRQKRKNWVKFGRLALTWLVYYLK